LYCLSVVCLFSIIVPPRPGSTLFPTRRSSDLVGYFVADLAGDLCEHRAAEPLPTGGEVHEDQRSLGGGIELRRVRRAHIGHRCRSEEHTSELQSRENLVCRLLLEKKKKTE